MVERNITRKADDRGRVSLGAEYAGEDVEMTLERSINVDELPTMKAVHFFGPPQAVRARLYAGVDRNDAEAVFGIHWDSGPVWEESYYANHENDSALKDFHGMETAAHGSIVAAYYGKRAADLDGPDPYNLNDYLVMGICPPSVEVQPLPYETSEGDIDFIKSLPLINTIEVSRDEYPDLFENVAGHSIYETSEQEKLVRKVYREKRD